MNDQDKYLHSENDWLALPAEIETELRQILSYWELYSVDNKFGGFIGRIDEHNKSETFAPKGSILNARILWTFSAAFQHTNDPAYLAMASRAFRYIKEYITDRVFGGLYWSVNYQGEKLEVHKQVYAQAFGIYGMSEYYRVTRDEKALELALDWYRLIEKYSRDSKEGGYIDAFDENWGYLDDKRLSVKDENASKTMNTHLHILEAYANLYEVWPSQKLKINIIDLLKIFDEKIINHGNHHLSLFFETDWKTDSAIISYGHDIEAAWLLQSCAESIQDEVSIQTAKKNALAITKAAMEGLDADGGLWYEYNRKAKEKILEKHWWPQAEALIGFLNAWQLSGDEIYKTALMNTWHFIRHHIRDTNQGEWLWGIDRNKMKMAGQDKIGPWKCPYHNSRACMELIRRFKS